MNNWEIILSQARKNLTQQNIWTSFIEKRQYQVESVNENRIVITRLSGGQSSVLTQSTCETAIAQLNKQNQIRHGHLIRNVAKECALIQFHPNIFWDEAAGNIVWRLIITSQKTLTEEIIQEASDDEFEKILIAVNLRKYQSDFRKNLLRLYGTTCAVSGVADSEVLEAAHISNHAASRVNHSTNGILLRADLHILFDKGLLQIHPTNLTIHISPAIKEIEYSKFNGKRIINRIDGKNPSEEFLQLKWNSVDWTEK